MLEGTIRSYDVDLHHQLPGIVERVAKNTAAAYRCEAEVEYDMLTEVLVNDPDAIDLVRKAAGKVVSDPAQVLQAQPGMGGEDFSYFCAEAPGAFYHLGCASQQPAAPLHSRDFQLDERCLPIGCAMQCALALDRLNETL